MVLKANGAVPVLTDVHRGRLALAEELGMEVLSSNTTFSHVFETSGAAAGLDKGLELATSFTRITLLGISDDLSPCH